MRFDDRHHDTDDHDTDEWVGRIDVLGPVVVQTRGHRYHLRGKPAAVVCCLASAHPHELTAARLVAEIWPDATNGKAALHTTISRFRRQIGVRIPGPIVSTPTGYLLLVSADSCDLIGLRLALRESAAARTAQDWQTVATVADRALRATHDPPFPDLDCPMLALEAQQVSGHIRQLVTFAVEADLRTGVVPRHLGTLERYAEDDPLHTGHITLVARARAANGDAVGALRGINTARVRLAEVGLAPTADMDRLERSLFEELTETSTVPQRIDATTEDRDSVSDTNTAPHPDVIARQLAEEVGSLGARQLPAHSRVEIAARVHEEGTRLVTMAGHGHSATRADLWATIARAAAISGQPHRIHRAATEAVRVAWDTRSLETLITVADLTIRSLTPGEPHTGLRDVIAAARRDARPADRALVALLDALEIANLSASPHIGDGDRALDLADRLREEGYDSPSVRRVVLNAWLRAHEGRPDIERQLATATELVTSATSAADQLGAFLDRARLALVAGDRVGFEHDIEFVREISDRLGDAAAAARAEQLLAAVEMAVGHWVSAAVSVERAAALLAPFPVEQEIALVQRWWASLGRDPAGTAALADLAATVSMQPVLAVLSAFTASSVHDHTAARIDLLSAVWPGGTLALPHDLTLVIGLVGSLQVAAALDDRTVVQAATAALRPYCGQLAVAGDGIFLAGAVDRFVAVGLEFLDPGGQPARLARDRAHTIERSFGGDEFVAAANSRMLSFLNAVSGV